MDGRTEISDALCRCFAAQWHLTRAPGPVRSACLSGRSQCHFRNRHYRCLRPFRDRQGRGEGFGSTSDGVVAVRCTGPGLLTTRRDELNAVMAPIRPRSALSASASQATLKTASITRPQTPLLHRASRSEAMLVSADAQYGRAAPPQRSGSLQLLRQRSAAERRLIMCLKEDAITLSRSDSSQFLPRHQIHDRRFYRCNQENVWNNIWRVPKSRLKYLTPFDTNQNAVDAIDDRFRHQLRDDKLEKQLRRERHDQILAQFRIQRLRNVKRELRCSYPTTCVAGRRQPLAIRTPEAQSAAARHQHRICVRLSQPRHRRNRPECANTDMFEYRGLIVGDDISYLYTDQYEADNAALAYAHDLYRSTLSHQRESMDSTAASDEGNEPCATPRLRIPRSNNMDTIAKIANETRRELSEFEMRLMIARRR